jgi:hypothetical protein
MCRNKEIIEFKCCLGCFGLQLFPEAFAFDYRKISLDFLIHWCRTKV